MAFNLDGVDASKGGPLCGYCLLNAPRSARDSTAHDNTKTETTNGSQVKQRKRKTNGEDIIPPPECHDRATKTNRPKVRSLVLKTRTAFWHAQK